MGKLLILLCYNHDNFDFFYLKLRQYGCEILKPNWCLHQKLETVSHLLLVSLMIRTRSSLTMANLEDKDTHSSQSISPSNRNQSKWHTNKLLKYLAYIVAFGVAVYIFLIVSSPSPLKEHRRSRNVSYEQLTIVLNTFERHDLMQGMSISSHQSLLNFLQPPSNTILHVI